jgi:glutamate synthase domain-containing protein 1
VRDLTSFSNPYNEDKVISACSIFGMMDVDGGLFSCERICRAMENMHERGNGLGAGFAVYGIYPDHADLYAFHVMFTDHSGRGATEEFLASRFRVEHSEEIPTRRTDGIVDEPLVWRYFVRPPAEIDADAEQDYVAANVLQINSEVEGSFVFSSGKNMGVFKGVGFPEQIARFYRLEDYLGYIWTAHSRFPTNSQAWWGGAHPFCLLDWSVVHNGEISSYGANRAFLETLGYKCTLFTDTEVMAYAIDLLMRRQNLSPDVFAGVVAPPLWSEIDRMDAKRRELHTALRTVYSGLLMNGPFAVVIANSSRMMALTDRIRLRPLTAATRERMLYISSEEASIRLVCPELDHVWTPMGGVPIVGKLGELPMPEQSRWRVETGTTAAHQPQEVA